MTRTVSRFSCFFRRRRSRTHTKTRGSRCDTVAEKGWCVRVCVEPNAESSARPEYVGQTLYGGGSLHPHAALRFDNITHRHTETQTRVRLRGRTCVVFSSPQNRLLRSGGRGTADLQSFFPSPPSPRFSSRLYSGAALSSNVYIFILYNVYIKRYFSVHVLLILRIYYTGIVSRGGKARANIYPV